MTGVQHLNTARAQLPVFAGIREQEPIKLVGLRKAMEGLPSKVVPEFWERFSPYRGWIPGQLGRSSYGALLHSEEAGSFDYLTAVEVSGFEKVSPDWDTFEVPKDRYAIFEHRDHVSELRSALHTIFARSLPGLKLSPKKHTANRPILLERYADSFDLKTGWGGIEIWVPLAS